MMFVILPVMNTKPISHITVKTLNIKKGDKVVDWLKSRIAELSRMRKLDAAEVLLEYQHHQTPGYRVKAHLATPGPDITAEGRDHTIYAAATRTLNELHKKIKTRQAAIRSRFRRNETKRMPHGRMASSSAC